MENTKDIETRMRNDFIDTDKPTVENHPDKPVYTPMPRARYKESLNFSKNE